MAGTEMEERTRRKNRIRFLKKIIIFVLVMALLIPTVLSVILGVQLHIVKKELRKLQEQAVEVSAMEQAEAPEEIVKGAGAETGGDIDQYSADGVSVSKRDNAKQSNEEMAEDAALEDEGVRRVYLTFDDGPSSNTNRILDILAEYDVKATFFVVGKEEEGYRALYQRLVEEGHTLAMHSYSHKYDEIYESVDSYAEDLSKLQEFLYDTTGVWCRYCRFPGGSSNTVSKVDMHELIAYLDEQDITYFDWNISSGDATNSYISTDAILRNCMASLPQYHTGIILMHDASNKNTTVEALPMLIERIQAMENTVIVPITEDTVPIQHISND